MMRGRASHSNIHMYLLLTCTLGKVMWPAHDRSYAFWRWFNCVDFDVPLHHAFMNVTGSSSNSSMQLCKQAKWATDFPCLIQQYSYNIIIDSKLLSMSSNAFLSSCSFSVSSLRPFVFVPNFCANALFRELFHCCESLHDRSYAMKHIDRFEVVVKVVVEVVEDHKKGLHHWSHHWRRHYQ